MGSLKFATINNFASPIWSPSGIAMGALLLFGTWLAPAIFLGAFLTNLTVSSSIPSLLGIATGNMLEALIGTYIILLIMEKEKFKDYSELVAIVCASMIGSMISATFGVSTILMGGVIAPLDYGYSWYTWWSGDVVGILVILPLFFELHLCSKKLTFPNFKHIIYAVLATAFFVVMTYLVFVEGYNPAFAWILCPFLILAGIYLDKLLSRILLITIGILVVALTILGYGPFEFGSLNLNLIYIQSLLASYAFAVLFVRPLSAEFKTGKTFILTNIFGWATIFLIIFNAASLEKRTINDDLNELVNSSLKDIRKATDKYELLLGGAAALIQIKPQLTASEWQNYQEAIKLESVCSAIQGFGYIRYIQKSDENKFQKETLVRGIENFEIKTFDESYSAQFSDRFLVTFFEPHAQNGRAIGLDIGSEKLRREAAEKALQTKSMVATESLQLFVPDKKQQAFVLFHPVWDLKNQLTGWTFTPVVINTFYERALSQYANRLHFELIRNNNVIFKSSQRDESSLNLKYQRKVNVNIFGLDHTLIIYPQTEFFQQHSHSSPQLALLMTLFMLFVAGFIFEQLTISQQTERLIIKRTRELEDSKVQLINSSKMASLGEMASSMAHEINNPITIILGKVKVIRVMLEDLKVNHPALNDEITKIEQTTGRISKIVKGLKSFSRAAQNDPFELIPVEKIIQETLDLCFERLKANGIKLTIDPIPQVCLFCRPSQISQVFLNLLNNSSDALALVKDKFIVVKFKIEEPDRLFISITDSGPGIPPEIGARIMEPFFTTKGVGKGTGLGLSIAKGIIEDHGGSIKLDTKSPQTRFVIELPLKNVDQLP